MKAKFFTLLVACMALFVVTTNINAQNYGDLVFTGAGGTADWNTAINWSLSDGSGGFTGASTAAPTGADNVYILSGSSVTVAATSKCLVLNVAGSLTTTASGQLTVAGKTTISGTVTLGTTLNCYQNLEVKAGGKITSYQTTVPQTIFMGGGGLYDNNLTVTNNGTILYVNCIYITDISKLTFTGTTGTTILAAVGPSANSNYRNNSIVVDLNMTVTNYISMARWGSAYTRTLTVNAGKTLTLGANAYLHNSNLGSPSATGSGTENFIYNINGTLNAVQGVINLCTNGAAGSLNLTQYFQFNVGPKGVVKCGDYIRKHVGKAGTSITVTIAPGGSVIYSGLSYTTNQCAVGFGSTPGLSANEVTNSLITSANNQNVSFTNTSDVSLAGDSTIFMKGSYMQSSNLLGKSLVMIGGDSIQKINSNGKTISGLTINKVGKYVVLSSPLIVNGVLTLTSGNLNLDANNLTISAGGSVVGGSSSSHIVTNGFGMLTQTLNTSGATFPVGISADSYDPAVIIPTVPNDFSVKVYGTMTGIPSQGVSYNRGEWDIISTATTNTDIRLTPFELDYTTPNPVIGHYTGGVWVNAAATFANGTYSGTFNSFSPFATGSTTISGIETPTYTFKYYVVDKKLYVKGLSIGDVITAYTVNGQQVAAATSTIDQSSVSLNNAGIYIVKVKSGNTVNAFRVIVK